MSYRYVEGLGWCPCAAPAVGVSQAPSCCGGCASGTGCDTECSSGGCGGNPCTPIPHVVPQGVPGRSAFPVGFGQASTASNTATIAASAVSGWAVPLAVGAISLAAGFGLAYVISGRK
jgi:hypothetical protein